CDEVRARIFELTSPEDPADPEAPALQALRDHLAGCSACHAELVGARSFLATSGRALDLLGDEDEIAALAQRFQAGEAAFMAAIAPDGGESVLTAVLRRLREMPSTELRLVSLRQAVQTVAWQFASPLTERLMALWDEAVRPGSWASAAATRQEPGASS